MTTRGTTSQPVSNPLAKHSYIHLPFFQHPMVVPGITRFIAHAENNPSLCGLDVAITYRRTSEHIRSGSAEEEKLVMSQNKGGRIREITPGQDLIAGLWFVHSPSKPPHQPAADQQYPAHNQKRCQALLHEDP